MPEPFFFLCEFRLPLYEVALSPVAELLAAAAVGRREFGFGRDGAELGVEDDLLDGRLGDAVGIVLLAGQVETGDLESVEEQSGAAGIEIVGCDALEDEANGGLDGGSVFGQGKFKGGVAVASGGRAPGGVVVVTEFLVAKADGTAAASIVEDVAALEPFWFLGRCGIRHGSPPVSLGAKI